EVLTNFERYRKGTLEFFCEIFGVNSPKNGINGSKVGDYFKQGPPDEFAHYCLADCKATGELFQRLKNYYRQIRKEVWAHCSSSCLFAFAGLPLSRLFWIFWKPGWHSPAATVCSPGA